MSLALVLAASVAAPADAGATGATPAAIIKHDGSFAFTDGSSYFQFDQDGGFRSGPLGMSGRTITGRWTSDGASTFVIEGQWSWLNGLSAKSDKRKLTLAIQPPCVAQPSANMGSLKLYRCYVVVEELVRVK